MSEMYVLIKNGHFHRPGHKGYTSSILDAGMWPRDYVEHYVSDSRSEVKFDAALRHMTDKQQEMFACHHALSALGDPVVVAEALPELVEAALYMRAKRVEHGGGDEEDGIFENDVRCFDAAYAKLKARP